MKKLLIALLCASPMAVAQDDCKPCDKSEACCDDAKACATTLADTRKDLETWKSEKKKLSRVERDLLKSARRTLSSKDARMQALAPTFAAQADLLAAYAALESMSPEAKNAKVVHEMSLTYRAMARTVAGKKDAYPEPSLKDAAAIKAALVKAEADAQKAEQLWMAAAKAELSKEDAAAVADAIKLVQKTSPRMRALAKNSQALDGAMKGLKCESKNSEGDPRPAIMKTAKSLQDHASPYFKGVVLTAPKPMAPAPST